MKGKKRVEVRSGVTEREKVLADLLYETWCMLPGDLSLVYTENDEYWTEDRVCELNDRVGVALDGMRDDGWKESFE